MSAPALSIFVFAIYLFVIGAGNIFMPNLLMPTLGFPKTDEPWIRVMGIIIVVLGFYYLIAALNELTPFFWATVVGRTGILIGFSLLVIAKKAKAPLILFGLIDMAGGVWTYLAMQ